MSKQFGSKTRFNNRRRGNSVRQGSKTEIVRKSVPRISTLNKKIKRIENQIELKFTQILFNDVVDNVGDLVLLNGLAEGVSQQQRVGDEVHMTSVQYRGQIVTNSANVGGPVFVRMIVFWDRQANGAAPTIAASSGTTGTDALLDSQTSTDLTIAPYMYSTQDRFRVLYDKRWCLNPILASYDASGALIETYEIGMQFKKKVKLNRRVKYEATPGGTAGIADIATNSLYALFVSSEAANGPTVNTVFRAYYKDA